MRRYANAHGGLPCLACGRQSYSHRDHLAHCYTNAHQHANTLRDGLSDCVQHYDCDLHAIEHAQPHGHANLDSVANAHTYAYQHGYPNQHPWAPNFDHHADQDNHADAHSNIDADTSFHADPHAYAGSVR